MPSTSRTPVVFIPGLWMHADSWENWVDLFRDNGYEPIARSWPGVPDTIAEARAHPETMAGQGVMEIADHYARIIGALDARPIAIGHSFGGLIAQNLLGRGVAAGAIAIDAAPIKGVLPLPLSTLRFSFPALGNPANRNRTVALTAAQFRYGFGNAVSAKESAELYERWAIPGPGRPLFQAAFANFLPNSAAQVNTCNATRGPLLLIAGEQDHIVPPIVTRATLKQYRHSPAVTQLQEIRGRGHSLAIDSGWRDVADAAMAWLTQQSLSPAFATV
jgi:pimeloyl-ACP methyl ester carboxylesterase